MAKPAKATTAEVTARPRLSRVEAAAKRKRDQNLLLIGGGIFFALLIALVIYLNVRSQQPVAGEEVLSSQGNAHIEPGSPSPLEYNSVPPTSGPHYGNLAAWQVYSEPQRYEQVVHNLEDGGVVIYYQCPEGCPEIVDQLSAIVQPMISAGRHIVLMPNNPQWTASGSQPLHQDMGAKIALTAWTRLLKIEEVDEAKIRAFIQRYEGVDHHAAGTG
jgi:Protein of unknown function (DUF3105)